MSARELDEDLAAAEAAGDHREWLIERAHRDAARCDSLAAFVEENATNRETLENQLSFAIKTAPKLTIQGGTTEVLRGNIAAGLGLRGR